MANNSQKYVSLARLSDFLANLNNKFAALSHKHTVADISDYKVDTELSSTSANPVQNKVIEAEFDAISTAMNALDAAIDNKANASHNHDDKYYTEAEIDNMEFITINDIDTICGQTIMMVNATSDTF